MSGALNIEKNYYRVDKKIFSTIAETNPQILLRGDTETLCDEDRSVIVES